MNWRALVIFHRWLGLIAGAWLMSLRVTSILMRAEPIELGSSGGACNVPQMLHGMKNKGLTTAVRTARNRKELVHGGAIYLS